MKLEYVSFFILCNIKNRETFTILVLKNKLIKDLKIMKNKSL